MTALEQNHEEPTLTEALLTTEAAHVTYCMFCMLYTGFSQKTREKKLIKKTIRKGKDA